MDDPIGGHPTRAEQLAILVDCASAVLERGDALIDLGCGTGYLAHVLLAARPDVRFIGIDRNPESIASARSRFGERGDFLEGDLGRISELQSPANAVRVVTSALTFHDLADVDKRAVLSWAADHLEPEGVILLYDRIRLTEPATFPLQRALWHRIERIHGRGMREAESFDAYLDDLSETNRPASLDDYRTWLEELGFAMQILHLHGNVALIGGVRRP